MRYTKVSVSLLLSDKPFFHIQYYIHKLIRESIEKKVGLSDAVPIPHHIDALYDKRSGVCWVIVNLFGEMRKHVMEVIKLFEEMTCLGGIGVSLNELMVNEVVVNPPQDVPDRIVVRFTSPVRFLNPLKKNCYDPFPHPVNFYVSAANAAELLGLSLDNNNVARASLKIKVTKFKGWSVMINGLYKYLSPGWVGFVEYDLSKLSTDERMLIALLTETASHTGVGVGRGYSGHVKYDTLKVSAREKISDNVAENR